jgi:tetratricopeptide (TPR) repeat protein
LTRRALLAALAVAPLALAGCAAPQASRLRSAIESGADRPRGLPARASIAGVPFFAQREYECGPAALAMAMQPAGVRVLPDTLLPEVWVPARQGSLQPEMLAAPRRRGLLSVRLGASLEDPLRALAGGLPVVVFQNLGLDAAPFWHYAVLIGYDLQRGTVVLHTGVEEASEQSIHPFERTWVRGGSWAMTVSHPDRLPDGAGEEAGARGVAGLERVDPAAARQGWTAVLACWPGNRTAALGLGNAAWAAGDKAGARAAWQAAVRRHPDFADAWNNLAHALADAGERRAAIEAARRAVSLGGPRAQAYRETLDGLSEEGLPD